MTGITKRVTFENKYEGQVKDPMNKEQVAGFTGHTKINRREFGLNGNTVLEVGGVSVSEEVKINIDIQIRKED